MNDRIKRCTFSLPAVCNPSTAHATAAPFHTRNRAPTNAAAFTATVTVVLTDIHGIERVVVLTHDTAVSKQVCTTVYEALESVVAQPNAPQHVWTKVHYGNCYVPHSDVGSDVQPLLAPEGSGLGPALSLGVVEENLGEIGRGSFGAVFKVTPCFDLTFPSSVLSSNHHHDHTHTHALLLSLCLSVAFVEDGWRDAWRVTAPRPNCSRANCVFCFFEC